MKFKVTKKALKNGFYHIISIGYCNAQYLLKFETPFSYCTRVEGWACDNYDIDNVLISTGYAPLKDENVNVTYDSIKTYEDEARKISTDYSMTWEEQKGAVRKLLREFVNECLTK